jgi:hypothetical protein
LGTANNPKEQTGGFEHLKIVVTRRDILFNEIDFRFFERKNHRWKCFKLTKYCCLSLKMRWLEANKELYDKWLYHEGHDGQLDVQTIVDILPSTDRWTLVEHCVHCVEEVPEVGTNEERTQ